LTVPAPRVSFRHAHTDPSARSVRPLQRTFELVRDMVDVEQVGPLTMKGFQRPITADNVSA
jgi:hypothetical protein